MCMCILSVRIIMSVSGYLYYKGASPAPRPGRRLRVVPKEEIMSCVEENRGTALMPKGVDTEFLWRALGKDRHVLWTCCSDWQGPTAS